MKLRFAAWLTDLLLQRIYFEGVSFRMDLDGIPMSSNTVKQRRFLESGPVGLCCRVQRNVTYVRYVTWTRRLTLVFSPSILTWERFLIFPAVKHHMN